MPDHAGDVIPDSIWNPGRLQLTPNAAGHSGQNPAYTHYPAVLRYFRSADIFSAGQVLNTNLSGDPALLILLLLPILGEEEFSRELW